MPEEEFGDICADCEIARQPNTRNPRRLRAELVRVFEVRFENLDFALVFVWFLEGHLGSFGVILGLSGSSRSQLESSEGPLGII